MFVRALHGVHFSYYKEKNVTARTIQAEEADGEWERFKSAKEEACKQLTDLFEKAKRELGESEAEIIDIQRLMLEDGDFSDSVEQMIRSENYTAWT